MCPSRVIIKEEIYMAAATGTIVISSAGSSFDSANYPRFVLGDGTNTLTFVIDNNARGLIDTDGNDAISADYTSPNVTYPLEDPQKGRLVVPTFDESDGAKKALLSFWITDESKFDDILFLDASPGGTLSAITARMHFVLRDADGNEIKIGGGSASAAELSAASHTLIAKYGSDGTPRFWLYKNDNAAEYFIRLVSTGSNDWKALASVMGAIKHAYLNNLINIDVKGVKNDGTLMTLSSVANDTYTASETECLHLEYETAGFKGNACSIELKDPNSHLNSSGKRKVFSYGYDEYLAADTNVFFWGRHSGSPTDDQFLGENLDTKIYFRQGTVAGSGSDASLSTANIAEAIKDMINGSVLGITAERSSSTVNLTNDTDGNVGNVTITTVNEGSLFSVTGMSNAPSDSTAPTISSVSVAADNSTATVTFSEDVYNTNGGSGELQASDFSLSLSGGNAGSINLNATPSGISKTSQSIYVLTLNGTNLGSNASGNESLVVDSADDTSIFDAAGNAHTAASSGVSLNDTTALAESVTSTVGTGGGTVSAGNTSASPEASVIIPSNALDGNVSIGVNLEENNRPSDNGLGDAGASTGSPYSKLVRLTPHGTSFNSAVTIEFNLADPVSGTCPSNLQIWKRATADTPWYQLPSNLWSCSSGKITISTTSFSDYMALGGNTMARTKLNNAQLARLTNSNKVLPEAINITGSALDDVTVSASDLFIIQKSGQQARPVSASAMQDFFSSVDITETDTDSSFQILFADDDTAGGGDGVLRVDGSHLNYNPSSNLLTVGGDVSVGDDLLLTSDSAVISLGAGADATLTHDGTTGLTIAATPISIDSTGELHLNSTTGDIKLQDGGVDQIAFDLDGTAGEVIMKPAVDSDDLVFAQYDGTEVIRIEDNGDVDFAGGAGSSGVTITSAGQLTADGRVLIDDATDATSTTDGSLQTDGGLSVAKDVVAGNDVKLLSDSAVLSLGAGSDVTFTHDGSDGLDLASAGALDVDAGGAVSIDSTAGSITVGAVLADGQTLKLGKNGATEMVFTPHGTAGSEKISLVNTAGTADDAIKIDAEAGGVTIAAGNDSLILDADGTDADALKMTSAGGMDVDVADEISLTTTSADGHISLVSAHTAGVALHIDADAAAGSIVDIDAGILDVDVTGAASIDSGGTLSLGTSSEGVAISIGHTTSEVTVNDNLTVTGDLTVNGVTTQVDTTNLQVKDKNILINDGGAAASAAGAGIDIEENGSVTGYIRVADDDRGNFDFKAPNGNELKLDVNADKTITVAGALNIEADSIINQDLSSDSTAAQFGILTLTTRLAADAAGGIDIGASGTGVGDVYIADDKKLKFGNGNDFTMEYDEDGTDTMLLAGASVRFSDDQKLEFGAGGDASFEYDEDGNDVLLYAGANLRISDDVKIEFGSGGDAGIEYDEDGTDQLRIHQPAAGVVVAGTNPKLVLGDAGAEDTMLVFDGNAEDFRIGIDDGTDVLEIGSGASHGAQIAIKIDGDENVDIASHDGSAYGLKLAGTLVSATAGELNHLDGIADAAYDESADSVVFFDATDSKLKYEGANDFVGALAGEGLDASSGKLKVTPVQDIAMSGAAGSILSKAEENGVDLGMVSASLSQDMVSGSLQVFLNGLLQTQSGSVADIPGQAAVFDYRLETSIGPPAVVFTSAIDSDDVVQLRYLKK